MREDPATDVIEVWQQRPGLWRWRFVAGGDHTEILSNETYRSLQEALRSARVAYPEVPVAGMEETRRSSILPYVVAGFLGMVILGVAVWWLLRSVRSARERPGRSRG
jgi:hypothetical protein